MKILIAEDERVESRILESALVGYGHKVSCATDGDQAWELYNQNRPELVISDWVMPNGDGLDLCKRIRADLETAPGRYCYFIFLTERTNKESLTEAMQAGADDFLLKPLNLVELQVRLVVAERIIAVTNRPV